MTAEVKLLRVVDTDALHPQTKTANAGKDDRLSIGQFFFKQLLQFCNHPNNCSFRETTVATSFCRNLVECYFALTNGFGVVFSIAVPTFNVVLD
jgi:hypothetical protein